MAVRAFWERKATMFAAALQRSLARRVKASPIYEHAREKRGEVFVIARNCLQYVFFRGLIITAHHIPMHIRGQ